MPKSLLKAQRRGGLRSRAGCGNCKARHLKCDETIPYCRRCLKNGMICEGYPTVKTGQQASLTLNASPITSYAIPFRVPGSQQDRLLLHYFCVHGAPELSGYLSSEFWTRLVMQYSHDHIAVRHAAVALSYAHRGYAAASDFSTDSNSTLEGAIMHYNKAMRSLRKYLNNFVDNKQELSLVVPLICCVLFFCFESTQGNNENALQHLNSGAKILAHYRDETLTPHDCDGGDLYILEQMLARLDMQATMFDDARLPLLQLSYVVEPTTSAINSFKTVDDAQADLTRLQNSLMHFLISNEACKFWSERELPEELVQGKRAIINAYARWGDKFTKFERDQQLSHRQELDGSQSAYYDEKLADEGTGISAAGIRDPAQDPALAVLRIQYHVFSLLLAASLPYDPCVFDLPIVSPHRDTLNTVLDLAESVVTPRCGDRAGNRPLAAETGVVAPLFFIVMKCTDTAIFERAFRLLISSGRREGLFDARTVAEIAVRIMSDCQQHEMCVRDCALEWKAGDTLNKRVNGLAGVARNLGVLPEKPNAG
ncbi:hypothetical protein F5Y19DRAFT_488351 [Xylariaceae sp. FL1651]|nr:hypothetical protein F5Y19DRAFT_488351 [Xylariaceae sp. FL1651]